MMAGPSIFQKLANISSKKKVILFTAFAIINVFAVAAASIAWFETITKNAQIAAVAGDMNVSIEKVTAYKYVYPYYEGSTEFVNYDGHGQVKSYVVEDTSITPTNTPTSSPISFTLSNNAGATTCYNGELGQNDTPTATSIHYEYGHSYNAETPFRYYLLGDSVFNGVDSADYSTESGLAFSSKSNPAEQAPVILQNVVVPVGAEFIFFDGSHVNNTTCRYFNYALSGNTNNRFEAIENGTKIRCLKSGIYTFSYTHDSKLTISLQGDRTDEAIIGNGVLDITKISIDYFGMSDEAKSAAGYNDIVDYLPKAIHQQNTMVIFDVQLKYINVNPIEAGLKIIRTSSGTDNNSIYKLDNHYANSSYNTTGSTKESRNPMNASDFYCYSAKIAKTPYADADALWADMHQEVDPGDPEPVYYDGFNRFQAGDNYFDTPSDYQTVLPCPLIGKSNEDSAVVPGVSENSDRIYHCYVAVDYDYSHMRFFYHENRLGKNYLLDRDFGLYFTGTEYLPEPEASPETSALQLDLSRNKEESLCR